MALIEKLKQKAIDEVNDPAKQKAWVESGYDAAMKRARGLLPTVPQTDQLTPEQQEQKRLREALEFDLAKLEGKHRGELIELGAEGLRSTIALVGLGKIDEAAEHAARLALRMTANWGQVTGTILSTAEAGNQQKRDLDKKVASMKAVLKDLGVFAATRLLPLLITSLV